MKFIVDTDARTIASQSGEGDAAVSWFDGAGFELLSQWWLAASWQRQYSYQFRWLGRPIIQLPGDIVMMQDLIHRIRPTLIIETGVAHGGSATFHASMLKLLHGERISKDHSPRVIAIDIEIRPDNRRAIEAHSMSELISLIEGSSVAPPVVDQVRDSIRGDDRVLVVLDSDHSRDHVLAELEAYSAMVTPGSAIVVMDTVMSQLADLPRGRRAWRNDNPSSAIEQFLRSPQGKPFTADQTYEGLGVTHSPRGILMRALD